MASLVYNSYIADVWAGNCTTAHTYYAMLTTSAYAESRLHTKRNQITNEVTGTGYTAGGKAIVPSFSVNNTTNKAILTIPAISWTSSTITARKMVVYRNRGGAASADELVLVIDNGEDVVSSNGTLGVATSTWEIPLPSPI
jgi:hypothetical protein